MKNLAMIVICLTIGSLAHAGSLEDAFAARQSRREKAEAQARKRARILEIEQQIESQTGLRIVQVSTSYGDPIIEVGGGYLIVTAKMSNGSLCRASDDFDRASSVAPTVHCE